MEVSGIKIWMWERFVTNVDFSLSLSPRTRVTFLKSDAAVKPTQSHMASSSGSQLMSDKLETETSAMVAQQI